MNDSRERLGFPKFTRTVGLNYSLLNIRLNNGVGISYKYSSYLAKFRFKKAFILLKNVNKIWFELRLTYVQARF